MEKLNTFITSDGITTGVCIAIVGLFLIYGRYLFRMWLFLSKSERAFKLGTLFMTGAFESRYNEYNSTKTILVSEENHSDERGNYASKLYKTNISASTYFYPKYVLQTINVNPRSISAAPGLLTGLGVLGTFVGLAYSVKDFQFTDTDAIINSIKELMSGMNTAFYTSIAGMFFSLIYIIIDKNLSNKVVNIIQNWCEKEDKRNLVTQKELVEIENRRHEAEMKKLFMAKEKESDEPLPIAHLLVNANKLLSSHLEKVITSINNLEYKIESLSSEQISILKKLVTCENLESIKICLQEFYGKALSMNDAQLNVLNSLVTNNQLDDLKNVINNGFGVINGNQNTVDNKLIGISQVASDISNILSSQQTYLVNQNEILNGQSSILSEQKGLLSEICTTSVRQEGSLEQLLSISQENKSVGEKHNTLLREQSERMEELLTFYDDSEDETISVGNATRSLLENSNKQTQSLQSFTTDLSTTLNASLGTTFDNSIENILMPLLNDLEKDQRELLEKFDVMNKTIESPTSEMMSGLKQDLKETLEGIINEFKSTISDKAKGQLNQLADRLAQTGEVLNGVPQNVEAMNKNIADAFAEMVKLVEKMTQETSRSTSENTNRMQQQITAATTALANAISDVREIMNKLMQQQLADSESMRTGLKSDMSEIGSELKNNIGLISSTLSSTVGSIKSQQEDMILNNQIANETIMNAVDKKVGEMTEAVTTSMTGLTGSVNESIEKITDKSEAVVTHILGEMSGQMAMMSQSLQTTTNAIKTQQEEMLVTHQIANENIMNAVGKKVGEMSANVATSMTDMSGKVRESINRITDSSEAVVTHMLAEMNGQMTTMTQSLQTTVDAINNQQSNMMSTSQAVNDEIMNNLASKIDLISTAVSKTVTDMTDYAETVNESITVKMQTEFEKMTSALSKTITSVNNQQRELIELNQKTSSGLKNTLEAINVSTSNLINAAGSLGTIVAKMQSNILNFNTAAKTSAEASEKLSSSSDRLSRIQEQFITRAERLSDRMDESIENITDLVAKSSEMSSQYANEFTVIQNGLKSIFGQIQTGLNQYTTTVQNSTGEILTTYSESMTKALRSIEGVVQNLSDLVEELVDSIDKFKK